MQRTYADLREWLRHAEPVEFALIVLALAPIFIIVAMMVILPFVVSTTPDLITECQAAFPTYTTAQCEFLITLAREAR